MKLKLNSQKLKSLKASEIRGEVKKILSHVKTARGQFEKLVKAQSWVDDARKFAEKQQKEVKKLLAGDLDRVRSFIEKEKQELGTWQKRFPAEVKKLRKFVAFQRKDLEKMLKNLRKSKAKKGTRRPAASRSRAAAKA